MKNHHFLDLTSNNKPPTQITNITSISNSISHNIYTYTNIPHPPLTKSFSEKSDSNSPSLTSSTDNIFFSGSKRTLSELSNSEQDSPANKEPALLLNQEQTQPHRASINSIMHHAPQNAVTSPKAQDIVDLTDKDTDYYPKPNFEALTERQNNASAAHTSTDPIHDGITASSPLKNGITTKITIRSPIKISNDGLTVIKKYCKQETTQISENITNAKTIPQTPFVDPTYDAAFKYLFSKLELATSFIHSTLNLNNTKITSLKPINAHLSELQQGNHYNEAQAPLVVDGLFKVKTDNPQNNKMLVFLEMQRKNFPGFLMREQIYSALIAANVAKKGISKHYDKIPNVVGIIIALKNVLPKDVPYCSRISTKVQSKDGRLLNVQFSSLTDMHVFELEKFQNHPESLNINKHSSSSLQWLNFLLKCGKVKSIPENTSDIIKLAYNHMTRVNMTQQDLILINASQIKAQLEEQARNQQLIETARNAERQGEIKSAIKTIQNLFNMPGIRDDIIIQSVSAQLQPDQVTKTLTYIRSQKNSNHIIPNTDDIMEACNLLGNNTDQYEYAFLSRLTNEELPE